MNTYKILRYRKPSFSPSGRILTRRPRVIQRGLTLEQAQAHCSRPETKGKDWFDGYTLENA
jgi:hypothetical protein